VTVGDTASSERLETPRGPSYVRDGSATARASASEFIMGVESYSLGADVHTGDGVSLGGSITATPESGVDGFQVGLQIGDDSAPQGVESTHTQAWRMLDGSLRDIELPSISAEPEDTSDRVTVAGTALFEPTGEGTDFEAQPHASVGASFNDRGDVSGSLSGGVTLTKPDVQFTGSVGVSDGDVQFGLSDYSPGKSDPTGSFVKGDPQISGGSPKDLQELNQAARDETRSLLWP
jgi:hypothetical protein